MFSSCQFVLFLALTAESLIHAANSAPDLQYFRSDGGVARATGAFPDNLDAAEALRWRVPLDSGHSSPIVREGKIFVTTWRAESRELATVALDGSSGKVLWRNAVVPERVEQVNPSGNPATATVACDGQRVFSVFGSVGIFCYDLDGHKLWEQRLGPFQDEYGAASSPILFQGKVILTQDHDADSFLIAMDGASGRTVWKIARPDAVRSYSTPAVWMQDGRPEILVPGALQLAAYDPANGERLWWMNGLARIVIPAPVTSGPFIYMASWSPGGDAGKRVTFLSWTNALAKWDSNSDGKLAKNEIDDSQVLDRFYRMDLDKDGLLNQSEWERQAAVFSKAQNAVLALKPTGRGELPDSAVVWKHTRGVPYVATPVLDHGILWMVKDGGIVTKLEAATGKLLQEERLPAVGNYYASPVAGDGKVYFAGEAGTVSVVASETEWRVISSRDFHEKIYATPALGNGRIYVRTEQSLFCFEGRTEKR
jgi:outer membrane protein assembly factor BamB